MRTASALRRQAWVIGGAFAIAVALPGCGSGGSGMPTTITDTAAVSSVSEGAGPGSPAFGRLRHPLSQTAVVSSAARSCPTAALEAIEGVAQRVYQESATGRIVAEALQRLKSSAALAQAVEANDRPAAHRALQELLLNQIVSVRVTRGGRTLTKIKRGMGIAPRNEPLLNGRGETVGEVTVSVQGANGYAQTVSGLLHAQVVVRSAGRTLTTTLRPAPALAAGKSSLSYHGDSYRVDTFTGSAFPGRALQISLLTPSAAIAGVCAKRGATAAQAQADTLGLVAERVYYAEHEGSKAELLLHYVERSRPFREAVLAGNPKATRAAIIGFFRSHLHIVRVRVIRAGKLLIDVGGPHVLAPIPGVVRGAKGQVAARFLFAIQDDLGFQILAHAFTGAQVVMREGTREVMGSLSPGPAAIPNRGRVVYRGVPYQAYSFMAHAFPSGPLRISLLFAVG
jgi:hypothetical protein